MRHTKLQDHLIINILKLFQPSARLTTRKMIALASVSLIVLFSAHATAFSFRRNVDFAQCYEHLVQLNSTDLNNNTLYSTWNASHDFVSDPRHLVLTLQGCQTICGDGYNLWPSRDTLARLSLWVLPAIILLTHFQFPPLSAFNTAAVILHAAGDPLDSLWSMLARLETQRRLVRAAERVAFPWLWRLQIHCDYLGSV